MRIARSTTCATIAVTLVLAGSSAIAATPERVIATSAYEYEPAASADAVAWVVWTGKKHVARVRTTDGTFRVNAAGTEGYLGGIDGSTLVYQQFSFLNGTSDIYSFDLVTHARTKIVAPVSTRRWEYDASISGEWIMFARWFRTEDRKVLLYNTTTAELRTIATSSGARRSLRVGQVAGGYATFDRITYGRGGGLTSCEVFRYEIAADSAVPIANPNGRCQYGSSVTSDGTVFYGRSGFVCGRNATLRKLPLGGSAETLIDFADGRDFTSSYALDNLDGTADVYYDPARCGGDSNVAKIVGV